MIGLLGVAMTITLFKDLEFFVDYQTLAFAVVLCAAFGYFAYRAKTIDMSGVFTAVLFGVILITFAGVNWFFIVMLFFHSRIALHQVPVCGKGVFRGGRG